MNEQAARNVLLVRAVESADRDRTLITDLEHSAFELDHGEQGELEQEPTAREIEVLAAYTSGLLLDDGVIDPRDTREVLIQCLSMCQDAASRTLRPMQFGVARM